MQLGVGDCTQKLAKEKLFFMPFSVAMTAQEIKLRNLLNAWLNVLAGKQS
jgi:hypothetical protein